jgi:pimeloyl-ACP methyl ester carboxylesterase
VNPKTKYVAVDGIKIGYQVFGRGPVDLLYGHGVVSHLELMWGDPAYARFMNRIGSFARVITFDRRGMGVSQRIPRPPTLDERVTDIKAVLDAAGSKRAVVLGFSDGGMSAALFAATHPERVLGLILCCTAAKTMADEDQAGFVRLEHMEKMLEGIQRWGTGDSYELFSPTLVGGPMHRRLVGMFERVAASREMMFAFFEAGMQIDIKAVLPSIAVPTIVVQRTDDFVPFESGQYVAEHIAGARLIPIEGIDHVPYAGNANSILRTIEAFVSEVGGAPLRDDRSFQAILFADIADPSASRKLVSDQGGRVLEAEGSELLALFDSPVRAVSGSLRLVEVHPTCRVGIHSGECLVAGNRVFGAAVHLAARVRSEAARGQVLVSEASRALAPSEFDYRSIGSRDLKGISEPMELFEATPMDRQRSIALDPKLNWRDRIAVAIVKSTTPQARMLQRMTNRSYSRVMKH